MPDSAFPQCRIVPLRLLSPQTTEMLLTRIVRVPGIRRIVINGPGLPALVPSGPARGAANLHTNRRTIQVCDVAFEMNVQTGMVTLEVEDEEVIGAVQIVCDEFFTAMPYQLQTGRFMKGSPAPVDYARYGPTADEIVIGLSDPGNKDGSIIIPTANTRKNGGSLSDNMQMENTPDSIN